MSASGSSREGTRVLVVEDEPILRMFLVDLLEDAGYRTDEAHDAPGALAELRAAGDVSLVIIDVRIPGNTNGRTLAMHVRAAWPHIPILLTSAYEMIAAPDLPERSLFIPKPYQSEHMIAAVQQLVGSS